MSKLTDYTDLTEINENVFITQLDKKIYIKKILPHGAAEIYKKLLDKDCRNVVEIFEVFEYTDKTIVIEEYINGFTIQELLDESGTLDEEVVRAMTSQICDGLAFLHSLGIVHRDINPNNVILQKGGTVKIIDFDISRFVKKNASTDTAILGTHGYAAPEQFGFSQSDNRADVYAVGVLMNVMLTGNFPNRQLYRGALGKVIRRATQIDADNRYKTIKNLKEDMLNTVPANVPRPIKILRTIPGFRSWKKGNMVFALIIYVYTMLMIVAWFQSVKNVWTAICATMTTLLVIVIPYTLISDFMDIQYKISSNRQKAITGTILITISSLLIGSIFLAALTP